MRQILGIGWAVYNCNSVWLCIKEKNTHMNCKNISLLDTL